MKSECKGDIECKPERKKVEGKRSKNKKKIKQ
jgi:hypothetical protein